MSRSKEVTMDNVNQDFPAIYPGTNQNVAVGASHAESAAVGSGTTIVRLMSTVATYIAIGSAPTATTSSMILPANVPEYFGIAPGNKVSCLQVASGGTLSITEGA